MQENFSDPSLFCCRQDLSKHKTEVVNLLAMVDTFNTLVTNEPSTPSLSYPATNADIQSVLHNNR